MNLDATVRVIAALAAVGLLAAPAVARVVASVRASLAAHRPEAPCEQAVTGGGKDLHVVLDLAARLKAAECPEGVSLCQQLLDVMLGNTKGKK